MTLNGTSAGTERSPRIDWVDYAKGICIVMVVMMHSVLGVEKAAGDTGFMHAFVMFAQPFRMPDFFLISGLISRRRDRPRLAHLSRPQGRALRLAHAKTKRLHLAAGFALSIACRSSC